MSERAVVEIAMEMNERESRSERTIRDFGEQWTAYKDNAGYYGSSDLFADIWGPLGSEIALQGSRVADIGTDRALPVTCTASTEISHRATPKSASGTYASHPRYRRCR